jgi:hypothetical protein
MKKINKRGRIIKTIMIIQIIAVMTLLVLSAVSCKWTIGLVRGSGNVEKEERDVSGIDEIDFSGMGNLIITQGEEESLVVEADDNILPLIETDVFGDTLSLGYKTGYNFIPTSNVRFYLTVIDLDKISLKGAGKIDCDNLETDELEFEISGAGDIDFTIDADDLKVSSSGAGDMDFSGKVQSQDVDISGVGRYNSKELESKECTVTLSGAGSATVNVTEELDIKISGVGNVYYIGAPRIKQSISGLGKIESID